MCVCVRACVCVCVSDSGLIFQDNILANLYAEAFVQLTIGLTGESALCTFIKPLIVGDGFKFIYFHFILCVLFGGIH